MQKPASLAVVALLALGACASEAPPPPNLQAALTAPDRTSPVNQVAADYQIGPFDKITVQVFGQENLSTPLVAVDAGGQIVLPLIGPVMAAGKTTSELSHEIAAKLGEKYLQAPSVSVGIVEAESQRITVTGAVVESGVYALRGPTTLMQAVSMAKGPDLKLANLRQVMVFRTIEGKRAVAKFDYAAIRSGQADDPVIYGGDQIVVDVSRGRSVWQQVLSALPGFGVFAYF